MEVQRRWGQQALFSASLLGALTLGAACGPEDSLEVPEADLGESSGQLLTSNGLSSNGFSSNGLSANGLSANGLSANGLFSGTAWPTKFKTWCSAHIKDKLCTNVMTYVTKCACNAGLSKSISGTASDGGGSYSYSWPGSLGIADGFCAGSAPTAAEKYRMTGCLLAHVNTKAGSVSMTLSLAMQGDATNSPSNSIIADPYAESMEQHTGEGVLFGNLWADKRYKTFHWWTPTAAKLVLSDLGRGCIHTTACGVVAAPGITESNYTSTCQLNADGDRYVSCRASDGIVYPLMGVGIGQMGWDFTLANGATWVSDANASNGVLANIPKDTTAPYASASWFYGPLAPGSRYKLQIIYVNPAGAPANNCHIKVVNGQTVVDTNVSLPAGSGRLVKDNAVVFTAGGSVVEFRLYQNTAASTGCGKIDSMMVSHHI